MAINKIQDGQTDSKSIHFYGYPHATGMFSHDKSQLDVLLDQCDLAIQACNKGNESQANHKYPEKHNDVQVFRRAMIALKTNKPAAYQNTISRIEIHIEAEYLRLLSFDNEADLTDLTDFRGDSSSKLNDERCITSTNSLNPVKQPQAEAFKLAALYIFDDDQLIDAQKKLATQFHRIDSYFERYHMAKQRLAHLIEHSKSFTESGSGTGMGKETSTELTQKAFLDAFKEILANTASDEYELRADIVNYVSEPSSSAYALMHSVTSQYTQAFDELCNDPSLFVRSGCSPQI